MVAEPFGLAARADLNIRGIWLEGGEVMDSVYQYADNTTVLVEDVASMLRTMELLQKYCLASGVRVNMKKSKYMVIGGVAQDTWEAMLGQIETRLC